MLIFSLNVFIYNSSDDGSTGQKNLGPIDKWKYLASCFLQYICGLVVSDYCQLAMLVCLGCESFAQFPLQYLRMVVYFAALLFI